MWVQGPGLQLPGCVIWQELRNHSEKQCKARIQITQCVLLVVSSCSSVYPKLSGLINTFTISQFLLVGNQEGLAGVWASVEMSSRMESGKTASEMGSQSSVT